MFFWPEEYALASVSINDVWIFEPAPVNIRLKHQRRSTTLHDSIVQVIVDNDLHWAAAVGTGRVDLYHKVSFPQVPLHEGRRYRVFRSGRAYSFSCAKDQLVSSLFNRHRKGPGDFSARANEKKQVPL
jgi:hypothetical protein